jgi:palmitoyltransferase ZDHHC2/15/20
MATLGPETPPSSPPIHLRRKSWARRVERCCCGTLAYFPLLFVYGLTTWAVSVEVRVSFWRANDSLSYTTAFLGILLWTLGNGSYTIAVFTTPGSPLDPRQDWRDRGTSSKSSTYSAIPTYEHEDEADPAGMTTVTAKSSTGKPRYCKKCHTTKPDRAHHCSTCGRCVLKMDHHCPWLATCVGLHNYKAFLLFLIYTSLFCWLCFITSGTWVVTSIGEAQQAQDGMKIVNAILLAVLGGIIGLVLTGFTAWHVYLAVSGQTTIESLEKTRYLSPLKKSMEQQFSNQTQRHYLGGDVEDQNGSGNQEQSFLEHLKETHANALPGILRPEEGEETRSRSITPTPIPAAPSHLRQPSDSPAKDSLQNSFASLEARRERDRYAAYLDEQDSAKLPNAFDVGWKRNLQHVFGIRPLFWWLPVCNTTGDGWSWEVSPKWREAQVEIARERESRTREDEMWSRQGTFEPPTARKDLRWMPGQGFVNQAPNYPLNGDVHGNGHLQMQPLDRRKTPLNGPPRASGSDEIDVYDTSSDEDVSENSRRGKVNAPNDTANWNDIPDDFLSARNKASSSTSNRSRSRGRRKGD